MSDFLPPKKAPSTSSPSAHASSHQDGGSDEISVQGLSGQLADVQSATRVAAADPSSNDGDSLGIAGTAWADLFLASGGVVNFGNGNVTLTHASGVITLGGGGLVLAAGTTSLCPVKFDPSGALLTTPVDGGLEMDATNLYGCTDAGNRGYIPLKHFVRAASARNLPNDTNLNALFNSPSNGRLTLETGVYLFTALIALTSMSATSGNARIDLLGAGTATVTNWLWDPTGYDNAVVPAAHSGTILTSNASAASIVGASTATAMAVSLRGSFEVTGAGTLIPSVKLVTAAAAVLTAGSYFTCERIGATGVASVGQWD